MIKGQLLEEGRDLWERRAVPTELRAEAFRMEQ
jgi:hypothetical protein